MIIVTTTVLFRRFRGNCPLRNIRCSKITGTIC